MSKGKLEHRHVGRGFVVMVGEDAGHRDCVTEGLARSAHETHRQGIVHGAGALVVVPEGALHDLAVEAMGGEKDSARLYRGLTPDQVVGLAGERFELLVEAMTQLGEQAACGAVYLQPAHCITCTLARFMVLDGALLAAKKALRESALRYISQATDKL